MSPQPNLKLAILALGLGAFAIGTSEFAAMGLLPWYAADLGITEPQAGHVVSRMSCMPTATGRTHGA